MSGKTASGPTTPGSATVIGAAMRAASARVVMCGKSPAIPLI
jgi:hypothetical protein